MTVQTAQDEVQLAITNVLSPSGTLDSVLAGLGVQGVFDEVDEDQTFDYISFGPFLEMPDNYLNRKRGYKVTVQIDIWSRQPGFMKARQMLARLNQLLDQQTLTLATQSFVYCKYNSSQSLRDNDEESTRHIAVKYDICTQE